MASCRQAGACEHAVGHPAREKINVDEEAVLVLLNVKELGRLVSGAYGEQRLVSTVLPSLEELWTAWKARGGRVLLVLGGQVIPLLAQTSDTHATLESVVSALSSPPGLADLVCLHASAFHSTSLSYLLTRLNNANGGGMGHIVLAGGLSERAVESTARDGADLGYTVTLVRDAVVAGSEAAQRQAEHNLKGFARIRTTEQVKAELLDSFSNPLPRLPDKVKKTALLVIDVQYYCAWRGDGMHASSHGEDDGYFYSRIEGTMVPNIRRLQRRFRALGWEVVFTTIESLTRDGRDRSLDYKISHISVPKGDRHALTIEPIAPMGDEITIPKTSASLFTSTSAAYVLRNLGVTSLVLVGMVTNQCVESTARDAADLGFDVTVVSDATTAHSPQDQQGAEASVSTFGRVLTTDEVLAETLAGVPTFIKIAVLRPEDNVTYGVTILPSFQQLFQTSAPPGVKVELHDFDVKAGRYPAVESWKDYHGFLIPGSKNSAYDDEKWIHSLSQVIRQLHEQRRRMVGVCFGHQVIAHALGGKVERNPKGLSFGRRCFNITSIGSEALGLGEQGEGSMYYHHFDVVVDLPSGAHVLGHDERCGNHGMAIGEHIITTQGHPEFDTAVGKAALQAILDREGLGREEWGAGEQTDSVVVARRMVDHFLAALEQC